MMKNNLFFDIGYVTLNKKGEELCGDKVKFIRNERDVTLVLADGLGSGVKANILATLTSSMLCNMIGNGLEIRDAVETVARTLPVCKVRGIAYSTFSIIYINEKGECKLIEFDNPQAIILREGKQFTPERQEFLIENKQIFVTEMQLERDDVIVVNSDGVIHAGVGSILNFGWERKEVADYFESRYLNRMSARCLSSLIANACYDLYMGDCGDDTTVAVIKVMTPHKVNIMVGPPAKAELDDQVVSEFLGREGDHVVCGGTTSQIVAKALHEEVITNIDTITEEIPPIATIRGIDLVTEGVLTIRKLIEMSDKYLNVKNSDIKQFEDINGASRLGKMLFETATDIEFFIGRGVNVAHASLDIAHGMKMHLVEDLSDRLTKLGKKVQVKYC